MCPNKPNSVQICICPSSILLAWSIDISLITSNGLDCRISCSVRVDFFAGVVVLF